ncbi:hypothetical protein DFJ73DRAFT_499411 [Zopfochytrium polystomum]|nr:hypothetical protein DFJ73DRAFT_499411 [Zopfochytrium polystomum]
MCSRCWRACKRREGGGRTGLRRGTGDANCIKQTQRISSSHHSSGLLAHQAGSLASSTPVREKGSRLEAAAVRDSRLNSAWRKDGGRRAGSHGAKGTLCAAADPALSFAVPSSGRDAPAPSDVPVHIGVDGRPHVATTLSNEVYVQEKTAAVCIEILDREIKHASQEPVYYWLPRTPVSRTKASSTARQLCDECTNSIFCGYWFCAVCGKEICMDCFETALETSEIGHLNDAWRCASAAGASPLKAHRNFSSRNYFKRRWLLRPRSAPPQLLVILEKSR